MVNTQKGCFLDTGVFYRTTEQLRRLVKENFEFFINSIVYYEFINTIDDEINKAKEKNREKRIKLLSVLLERFSEILDTLNVTLLDTPIYWNKTSQFLNHMEKYGMNIGDVLIWETIKYHNIDLLVTTDKDWERTGINSLVI